MTRRLRLRKVATPPAARSGQETVFVDRDDSHLKLIDSAGSVTDLESGGGITNSAPDTALAVSDGTNLVGSADLIWDANTKALGLAAADDDGGTIEALGLGAQLVIRAANGGPDHVGGELNLIAGGSDGQGGGGLIITSGGDSDGGDSGPVDIASGAAPDGQSGDINLRVSGSSDSYQGGSINIVAGTGQGTSGGSVVIQAGPKVTGGSHGHVTIYSGDTNNRVEFGTAGVFFTSVTFNIAGLPTSDPLVAGQLYTDGATSAGVPKALMVSGG